jgi:hypothetical protein
MIKALWLRNHCLAIGCFLALSLGSLPAAEHADVELDSSPSLRRLQLVRPDSLAGWDHSAEVPKGWTADGTQLMGGIGSTPLVSGWSCGDFVLDFSWRDKGEGVLEVQLLDVPEGPDLKIALASGDHCGAISEGDKVLAPGGELKITGELPRWCRVTRAGETLRVWIYSEQMNEPGLTSQAKIAADRRFALALHVPQGAVAINSLTLVQPLGESLFNGKDLTNWRTHRKQDVWAVDGGELVTTKNGGEYLRSEKEYSNFTLSFDYKMDRSGNSGVGLRTPREGWPSGDGFELQLYDRPGKDASSQMSVYKYLPPLERPDISDAWNRVVIKCDGPMITAWVNGQIAQHANLARHPQLAKKPLSGWVGFQNHGSMIRIKNVHLLEAPQGMGLAAWTAQAPQTK